MGRPPAERAPRSADLGRGCNVGQRAARSNPYRQPRLDRTNNATTRWLRMRKANGPRSTRREVRTWRGCGAGHCAARSSPHRRPRRDRTDTATGHRQKITKVSTSATESCGARPARVSQYGVAAHGPRSTRHAARTWRGCVESQRAARSIPTPSVEAQPHQYRDRSAAGGSKGIVLTSALTPWRASRARIVVE